MHLVTTHLNFTVPPRSTSPRHPSKLHASAMLKLPSLPSVAPLPLGQEMDLRTRWGTNWSASVKAAQRMPQMHF